jgi:hypothetical protein
MDVEFFSTQHQNKIPDFEFISKSYGRFTEPPPSYGFKGAVPTRIENWVKQRR